MGLSRLVLVAPQRFPDPEAWARASGAEDLLESARVVYEDSLRQVELEVQGAYSKLREAEELIQSHFDLRPAAIIRDLKLLRPIYQKTAAYGHFGREDADFTWESTDKAAALRSDAGLA